MKRCLALISVLLCLLPPAARAQGPDETYLAIYNLIQQADAFQAGGDARQAAAKYLEAHSMLKVYPTVYPGWNEKVVTYRLNYLSSKLEALAPSLPATNTPPAAGTNAPPGVATASANQARALQDEIDRLTAKNALLEAKLKEAWSVQPAAADPRELAKAGENIKQLQKEIDVLKVTLAQEQAKPAKTADPVAIDQEKKLLDELKQKLAQQVELNGSLQKENTELKDQVNQLKTRAPSAGAVTNESEELHIARSTIAALQATNIALRTDKILLETRILELAKEPGTGASSRTKELINERDDLKKKLAAANKELKRVKTRTSSSVADSAAQELESLLARLEVHEAKAVPYSPEELVLFKQGDTNLAVAAATEEKVTVKELPPGSGPLVAEATAAARDGRFKDAEKLYLQVLSQDEKHVLILSHLAGVQIEQERYEEADQTIHKALAIEPRDALSLYILGILKQRQAKYDEAFEALSLSAKIRPSEARTQYSLGEVLVQKGQRAAAETAFRKTLLLMPTHPGAHHALAVVYATQQPPFKELAQWHYNKARDKGWPRDPDLEKLFEEKPPEVPAPQTSAK